jgi:hypothetical protein
MRVLVLLGLLVGAVGFAGYAARQRYPTETIKVPGSARTYQIVRAPDQCWGRDCFIAVAFMTKGTDRATWRAEAQELEPWLVAQARTGGQRGAAVLAIRPGFARLFPPTKVRYFVMGGSGVRWKIIKEGDGGETMGITE